MSFVTQNPNNESLNPEKIEAQAAYAMVLGEPLIDLPQDLYIPPNALKVFLESFSGPLDLLLYLIKKQNLNILDIPIARITTQYVEYIDLMQEFELELAAEYLLMAATLAEIKSRLLLPKPQETGNEEEDPRAELIRKLQEYEQYRKLAESIDALPRLERDISIALAETPPLTITRPLPEVKLDDLVSAFKEALERAKLFEHHHVRREIMSVRERMTQVLQQLQKEKFTAFSSLFKLEEGRIGVVITFVSLLELLKQSMIELVQTEPYGMIHVKAIEIND
jgi:segregation and condensation protein A